MKRPVLAQQNVRFRTIALVLALGAFAPAAHAGILTPGSVLNFTGNQVTGSASMTFQCNQAGDPACVVPPAGSGDFAVVGGSTSSFAQYNGTFGLIKSVNDAVEPLNSLFSLPNFITFDLNNQISLELTFLPLGSDPLSTDCAGIDHCTPKNALLVTPSNPAGLSGFNLDKVGTFTTATFFLDGIAHGSNSTTASFSGSFTAVFAGLNPQQTLASMLAGNAYTYSGSIQLGGAAAAGVPEPASIALFGVALVGAVGFGRRRKRS